MPLYLLLPHQTGCTTWRAFRTAARPTCRRPTVARPSAPCSVRPSLFCPPESTRVALTRRTSRLHSRLPARASLRLRRPAPRRLVLARPAQPVRRHAGRVPLCDGAAPHADRRLRRHGVAWSWGRAGASLDRVQPAAILGRRPACFSLVPPPPPFRAFTQPCCIAPPLSLSRFVPLARPTDTSYTRLPPRSDLVPVIALLLHFPCNPLFRVLASPSHAYSVDTLLSRRRRHRALEQRHGGGATPRLRWSRVVTSP